MPAIRGMGFDEKGNFWVEPNWVPDGVMVGLHVDEIATMDQTGQPISVIVKALKTVLPFTNTPVITDPTKAANAKAQTLQTRLDGLMASDGTFRVGQVVVTVDKATQGIQLSDA